MPDGGIQVGQAWLSIVPSFAGVVESINKQAAQWAKTGGQTFSDTWSSTVARGTGDAQVGPSTSSSSKQGATQAGAFADGFRKALDAALKDLPQPKITADSSAADRAIAEVRAGMEALRDKKIGVDISAADALASLANMQAELDFIGRQKVSPQVSVDVAKASAELAAFRSDVDTTSKSLGGIQRSAESAGIGFGGLMSNVAVLSPALLGIGTVGAAGVAAVGAAAATSALGLGAFALAAKNDFSAVSGEAKQMLADFQQANEAATMPAVQGAVALLPGIFRDLTPLVQGTSSALVSLEGQVQSALGDPRWSNFFTFLGGQANEDLKAFGAVLTGAATAFRGLDQAFAPVVNAVDAGLVALGRDLTNFGNAAAGNAGLQGFVQFIMANGPRVVSLVESLGSDFLLLARDLAPLVAPSLEILNFLSNIAGDLLRLDPLLPEVGLGFLAASKGVSALSSLLGGGSLANLKTFVTTLGGIRSAGLAAQVGESAAGFGLSSLLGPLGLVATGVSVVVSLLGKSGQAAKDAGNSIAQAAVQQVTSQGSIQQQIQRTNALISNAQNANASLSASYDQVRAANQRAQVQYAASDYTNQQAYNTIVSTNGQLQNYQKQIDTNNASIKTYRGTLDQLNATVQGNTQAQQAMNAQQAQGTAQAGFQIATQDQLSKANSDLSKAVQGVTGAIMGLAGGYLTLDQGQNAISQSLYALSQSFAQNGSSIEGNTQQGLANRQALDTVSQGIIQQISQMSQQHKSIQDIDGMLEGNTQQIYAVGAQYGLSKDQVDQYLKSVGLTPSQVNTVLYQKGFDTGLGEVNDLRDGMNQLTDKSIDVAITFSTKTLATALAMPVGYAEGGIVKAAQGTVMGPSGWAQGLVTNRPTYLVGEDGSGHDEYVIPTNPKYRPQAFDLLGQLLPAIGFANGGVFSSGINFTSGLTANMAQVWLNFLAGQLPDISGTMNSLTNTAATQLLPKVPTFSGPAASGPIAALAQQMAASMFGWTGPQWSALNYVEMREAGWNMTARNPSSGAYGIAQGITGPSWYYGFPGGNPNTPQGQIVAFLEYIAQRYGSPIAAAAHERAFNWYGNGGVAVSPAIAGVGETGPEAIIPLDRLGDVLASIPTAPSVDLSGIGHGGAGTTVGEVVHVENYNVNDRGDVDGLLNAASFKFSALTG